MGLRSSKGGPECDSLREELFDNLAVNIGEPEVTPLKSVGEFGVIEAEKVHDGRVQIMNVDFVLGGVEAEFVGFAHGEAGLDAAAGQPHRETIWMMIATIAAALDHGGAAKFAAPNNQCFIEETTLLEIFDECGGSLIGVFAIFLQVGYEVAVLIPCFMEKLDETNAALDQAARE